MLLNKKLITLPFEADTYNVVNTKLVRFSISSYIVTWRNTLGDEIELTKSIWWIKKQGLNSPSSKQLPSLGNEKLYKDWCKEVWSHQGALQELEYRHRAKRIYDLHRERDVEYSEAVELINKYKGVYYALFKKNVSDRMFLIPYNTSGHRQYIWD